MEKLLESILARMNSKGFIKENEEEIYSFGLECLLLKTMHYSSYIVISIILQMTVSMFLSAVVLIPLRRMSGGFHARTRRGCYLFSCAIVIEVCLLNKAVFPRCLFWAVFLLSNLVVIVFAPVENENRLLDWMERKRFRKQALVILMMADMAIIISVMADLIVCQWLLNGVAIVAQLILFGKLQMRFKRGSSTIFF